MSVTPIRPRLRLGEVLMEAGLLDEVQLQEALAFHREEGRRLGAVLVRRGFLEEETVTVALAQLLNLPPVHLDSAPLSPKVTAWLPLELAQRYWAFPLSANRRHRVLRVATSEPSAEAAESLGRQTGMRILFFLAGENALIRAIDRHYRGSVPPPAKARPQGATQADLAFAFPSTVNHRMAQLERVVLQQGFALRGMLDLLDQKGVIEREEFLSRLERKQNRPPPLPLGRTGKASPALSSGIGKARGSSVA